jgi:DnaK suppressor protein
LDFDTLLGGHVARTGTRADLAMQLGSMEDLGEAAQAALNRDGNRRLRHRVHEPETGVRPHGRFRPCLHARAADASIARAERREAMTPHGPTAPWRRAVDIEHYRTLLQNQERRLLGIIKLKKENVRSIGGDSVPDAGDASYEGEVREEQAREAENASDTLKEVRLALARIDAGTFGLCENGGEHIEEKRLEAIPWTRYCSAHEAEAATGPGPRRATL